MTGASILATETTAFDDLHFESSKSFCDVFVSNICNYETIDKSRGCSGNLIVLEGKSLPQWLQDESLNLDRWIQGLRIAWNL